MRRFARSICAAVALLASAASAFGQSVPTQGGPSVPGHVPVYVGAPNTSQVILGDGGAAGGGAFGTGISELGVIARGTGTAPYVGQGTGPFGTNICDYDAPITNAGGYHFMCWSPNATGNTGLITFGAGGGAAPIPLLFNINGTISTIGGGISNITVGSTTIGSGTSGAFLYNNAGVLGNYPVGTGVSTALGINVGTAGSFVTNGGALGTPSSGVATNLTGTAAGLTAGTVTTNANLTGAVTSTGNATSLGSFTSANLRGALTDETGTGVAYFQGGDIGTPSAGVATNLTALNATNLGSGTVPAARLPAGQYPGTTTNDNATAGNIGEFVSSTVLVGSAVGLTTTTPANVTSILLTAGDWDVSGLCLYTGGGTTVTTLLICWSSSTNAVQPVAPNNGGYGIVAGISVTNAGNLPSVSAGHQRFSLSGTTVIYLSTLATFTTSTESVYGFIRARRVR